MTLPFIFCTWKTQEHTKYHSAYVLFLYEYLTQTFLITLALSNQDEHFGSFDLRGSLIFSPKQGQGYDRVIIYKKEKTIEYHHCVFYLIVGVLSFFLLLLGYYQMVHLLDVYNIWKRGDTEYRVSWDQKREKGKILSTVYSHCLLCSLR